MVKPAQDGLSSELAEPLRLSTARRILPQGQMRSQFVSISGVGRKDPAQMGLTDDNGMIEAFPATDLALPSRPSTSTMIGCGDVPRGERYGPPAQRRTHRVLDVTGRRHDSTIVCGAPVSGIPMGAGCSAGTLGTLLTAT